MMPIKMVLLGEPASGKSTFGAILKSYFMKEENLKKEEALPPPPTYKRTFGSDIIILEIKRLDNKEYVLHIWDVSGNREGLSVTQTIFRKSHAAILVIRDDQTESINALKFWISDFFKEDKHQQGLGAHMFLLLNENRSSPKKIRITTETIVETLQNNVQLMIRSNIITIQNLLNIHLYSLDLLRDQNQAVLFFEHFMTTYIEPAFLFSR